MNNPLSQRLANVKTRVDKVVNSPIWRPLGGIAAVLIILLVIYTAATVHQHNIDLDCLKHAVNQALGEAFHHRPIAPPVCK